MVVHARRLHVAAFASLALTTLTVLAPQRVGGDEPAQARTVQPSAMRPSMSTPPPPPPGLERRAEPNPLPTVAALPAPRLPDWIASVAPIGKTYAPSQIRIAFVNALDRTSALPFFHMFPPVAGRFRFVTSRLVEFETYEPLPISSRFRISIDPGLRDVRGNLLAAPLTWSFETAPLALTLDDPYSNEARSEEWTTFLSCNVPFGGKVHESTIVLRDGAQEIPVYQRPSGDGCPILLHARLAMNATYSIVAGAGFEPFGSNLESKENVLGTLTTAAPLALVRTTFVDAPTSEGAAGRFINGTPALVFNNFIDQKTVAGNITIAGVPSPDLKLTYSDRNGVEGTVVRIDPMQLQPNAPYDVHIGPGLADNFGQHASERTVAIHTAALPAQLEAPSGLTLAAPDAPRLFATATGVSQGYVELQTRALQRSDLLGVGSPQDAIGSGLPGEGDPWPHVPTANTKTVIPLEPPSSLPTYGVDAFGARIGSYAYRASDGEPGEKNVETFGFINRTNLGVHAESIGNDIVVRVNRLDDGAAAAHAHVQLLPMLAGQALPNASPCAQGDTDEFGIVAFHEVDYACLKARAWWGQYPATTIVASSGADWTFVPLGDREPRIDRFFPTVWYGAVLTDRGIYRPGDTIHASGFITSMRTGTLAPVTQPVSITFDDKAMTRVLPDRFGRWHADLAIPATAQAAGTHEIVSTTGNIDETLGANVVVSEPRIPAIASSLSVADVYTPGQTAIVTATVSTSTGERLADQTVNMTYSRSILPVEPFAFRDFTFAQALAPEAPDQNPPVKTLETQTSTLTTDRDGTAKLHVPIEAALQLPARYDVTSTATARNDDAVDTNASFAVVPRRAYAGLSVPHAVDVSKSLSIRVVASDASGRPAAAPIRVELYSITYSLPNPGDNDARNERYRRYSLGESRLVPASPGISTVSFAIPAPGDYRVRAYLARDPAHLVADVAVTAYGSMQTAKQTDVLAAATTILLDKPEYRAGDVATAAIRTPFSDADVLIEVQSNGRVTTAMHRIAGSGQVSIPIAAWMLPSVNVRAVAFERDSGGRPMDLNATVSSAETSATIDLASHRLALRIVANASRAKRGGAPTGHVTVTVRDASGRPTAAACIIAVVDDAILSLDNHRFTNLTDSVFANRPSREFEADNRRHPALLSRSERFGTRDVYSIGAVYARRLGKRPTLAPIPVKAVAYFNATAVSNAAGTFTASFPLPPNRTRWRVMVATSSGPSFGNGEASFVSFDKARIETRLRFARAGDRFPERDAPRAASSVLDASLVPETPAFEPLFDGGAIAAGASLTLGPFDNPTSFAVFGLSPREIEDAKTALNFVSHAKYDVNTIAYAKDLDRTFLRARLRHGYRNGNDDARTLFLTVPIRIAAAESVDEFSLAELRAEARDPSAAGICEPTDPACIGAARLYALDALEAAGIRDEPSLAAIEPDTARFDYSERLMYAMLLLRSPKYREAGIRLAAELDSSAYVGANRVSYPSSIVDRSDLGDCQAAGLQMAIARGDDATRLAAIVRGGMGTEGSGFTASIRWPLAVLRYAGANRARSASYVVTGAERVPDVDDGKHAVSRTEIPASALHGSAISIATSESTVFWDTISQLPTTERGLASGIQISRDVRLVKPDLSAVVPDVIQSAAFDPISTTLPRHGLVAVTVRVHNDHPLRRIVVVEKLPAALEAIDPAVDAKAYADHRWADGYMNSGGAHFIAGRIEIALGRLDAGTFEYRYLARIVAPGTFTWPAASATANDESGDYGRTAAASITVSDE